MLHLGVAEQLIASLGLGALVVIGYSQILRRSRGGLREHVLAALVLAGGALLSIVNPITLGHGYTFSPGIVFVAVAGFYAGTVGALLVIAVAIVSQFLLGAQDAISAIMLNILIGIGGLFLARWGPQGRSSAGHVLLGCCAALVALLLIAFRQEPEMVLNANVTISLIIVNIAGIVLMGCALQASRRNADQQRIIEFNAERDPLTGLYNRRALDHFQRSTVQAGALDKRFGCVILFDIDRFKRINDQYGHRRGDEVLRFIAATIASRMRRSDIVVRYGGEEILALLPSTSIEDAHHLAEHIRLSIEKLRFSHNHDTFSVTISIGIADFAMGEMPLEAAVDCADRALYQAKSAGRNRTEIVAVPALHVHPMRANG